MNIDQVMTNQGRVVVTFACGHAKTSDIFSDTEAEQLAALKISHGADEFCPDCRPSVTMQIYYCPFCRTVNYVEILSGDNEKSIVGEIFRLHRSNSPRCPNFDGTLQVLDMDLMTRLGAEDIRNDENIPSWAIEPIIMFLGL